MSILGNKKSNDLLEDILNKLKTNKVYVEISDNKSKVSYLGWLESTSGRGDYRDFLLSDSETYSFDDKLISKAPRSYISLRSDSLCIAFKAKNEETAD